VNPIIVSIPGAVVTGELMPVVDPSTLDQDVLQVVLPNDVTIDVGWYPSNDPDGRFRIVTYRDYWRNTIRETVETTDPFVVADTVRAIAEEMRLAPPATVPQQAKLEINSLTMPI
jgi:hypothetical protein